MERGSITGFAWLSIAAALATIAMKGAAYRITGSVALLSDALESLVNLAAALMALAMLTVAARPPDAIRVLPNSGADRTSRQVTPARRAAMRSGGTLPHPVAGPVAWPLGAMARSLWHGECAGTRRFAPGRFG